MFNIPDHTEYIIQATDEMATKFLKVALSNDKFYNFLFSTPLYDLKVRDGYGGGVHSARHVMSAIYREHMESDSIDFSELITNVIVLQMTTYKCHPTLLNLLDNLKFHINEEKNGRTPFKLDIDYILDAISTHIAENKSVYKQPCQTFGESGMWPYLQLADMEFNSCFGKGFMKRD